MHKSGLCGLLSRDLGHGKSEARGLRKAWHLSRDIGPIWKVVLAVGERDAKKVSCVWSAKAIEYSLDLGGIICPEQYQIHQSEGA